MVAPAAGDPVLVNHVLRARPTILRDVASGSLAASMSNVDIPGISIGFTTETDGAELTLFWNCQFDLTGATTTNGSARPAVTGPSAFSASSDVYATYAAEVATDQGTTGNVWKTTLGVAGAYTITLKGTTPANMTINVYTSMVAIVQEQWE